MVLCQCLSVGGRIAFRWMLHVQYCMYIVYVYVVVRILYMYMYMYIHMQVHSAYMYVYCILYIPISRKCVIHVYVIYLQGPLMFHVTKLFPTQDATVFHAFGRVISGTCESPRYIFVQF